MRGPGIDFARIVCHIASLQGARGECIGVLITDPEHYQTCCQDYPGKPARIAAHAPVQDKKGENKGHGKKCGNFIAAADGYAPGGGQKGAQAG